MIVKSSHIIVSSSSMFDSYNLTVGWVAGEAGRGGEHLAAGHGGQGGQLRQQRRPHHGGGGHPHPGQPGGRGRGGSVYLCNNIIYNIYNI